LRKSGKGRYPALARGFFDLNIMGEDGHAGSKVYREKNVVVRREKHNGG